jgi:Flp pilus assembly protein protease CpaA
MLLSMELSPQQLVLLVGVTVGAVMDLWSGRIPNVLTFPMMVVGIALHAIVGPEPLVGLIGCAAAFALHFPLFAAGIEKGGDAKLMMGVGAAVGWATMVETTLWLAVLYLPVGLAVLAAQGKLGNLVATARYVMAKWQGQTKDPPPDPTYFRTGPVIAVGAVLAWLTDWLALV